MTPGQNDSGEDTQHHELVIIRRRGNGDDAPHHGGVWKIAHADFMTALMAFFMVMWLINATDDKTITGVANYFNPVRLNDSTARPKGIFAVEPGSENGDGEKVAPDSSSKHKGSKSEKKSENGAGTDAKLFSEPYEALDKLAAEAGKDTAKGGTGIAPRHAGEAFRDPFDPDSRFEAAQPGHVSPGATRDGAAGAGGSASQPQGLEAQIAQRVDMKDAPEDLRHPIEQAIEQAGLSPIPGIDVRRTDEGVLISIMDQPDFEMFGIASAEPQPDLVVLLEKIGKTLVDRPEQIVIRGHTDGRPFRPGGYDNWRLSSARAQMAYYMLMRSGIPEGRVKRIEGHADHQLKDSDNPLAAENRRIEILLTKDKS